MSGHRPDRNHGLRCPECGNQGMVVDSRTAPDLDMVRRAGPLKDLGGYLPCLPYRRRRYECTGCAHRWTTVEVSADRLLQLIETTAKAAKEDE